jgi:hypothetical protein
MNLAAFRASLSSSVRPAVSPALVAMWWDGKGDWTRAHEAAQAIDDEAGAWVHAYLHRKEGDLDNAAYWYRRARKEIPNDAVENEWERIVEALLYPADGMQNTS